MFLPDPDKALMIGDDADGMGAVYTLDLATLKRGEKLFGTAGFDIDGIETGGDGWQLLGVETNQDRRGVHWIDPRLSAIETAFAGHVAGGHARIVSFSRDLGRAILFVGGANSPGAYFAYDVKTDDVRLLSYVSPALGLRRQNPVETIRYALFVHRSG
jgi:hypothetical protein